ncbi:hypothetical protein D1007_27903 [Hordeum vulgare]|nr:hypothetical protein D1007_27903 [Hordeum vulgare]
MPLTRKHGIVRLLVGVLYVEYVPHFVPWSYDGMHYDLEVEVEEPPQEINNFVNNDVDMMDGSDGSGNQGADGNLRELADRPHEMG